MLHPDGTIDIERTAKLTELAYPMQVTFHRAFDRCSNPFEALEQIINLGCSRILTSGQRPTAMEGIDLLGQLTTLAANRIIIMPGGGINSRNIETLSKETGATEFHAAARLISNGAMTYHVSEMEESLTSVSVNTEEVSKIQNQLKR
jgi:copper homeostasis protein